MDKKIIPIKGMHCRSCEILIEDELSKVPGVQKVEVSQKNGEAIIYYSTQINVNNIRQAVINAGYLLGYEDEKPWLSRNINDYLDVAIYGVILAILFFVANDVGLFKVFSSISNNYTSLPIVFIVGLTAGLSTCMALVGGLVLGASARFAEKHPTVTTMEKFKPHLFFNFGRIIFYLILGGVIGYLGSFFQMSPTTLGFLTIAVGIIMLLLGLQLTELFPRLSGMNITLPKGITRILGIQEHSRKEYSHQNSFIMGALTFFLPCGFTQAMQLFAISSGNPVIGALTMGVFALGTAPGLLGIGGLTSVLKGVFAKSFFKFAGIVVVLLAFFNMANGYNLTGLNVNVLALFNNSTFNQVNDPNVTIENGVQIVKMTQDGSGYSPNSFTIKKGIPVRWIINSINDFSCASSIVSAKLGISQGLILGENIIEFTPQEIGQIRFSCAMGMYTGEFNVIDESGNPTPEETKNIQTPVVQVKNNAAQPSSCSGGGGGCGCGGGAAKITQTTPIPAIQDGQVQVIKASYSIANDIQPNNFMVKSGQPVRFEIEANEDGAGCMGSIALPGLSQKVEIFTKGKSSIFEFTPDQPGRYRITCAMGVPRGSIIVN